MEKFIDPKTLARVKDMPLIAKTVAEGFLHGLHSSRQRGVGIEFNQYRAYEPGDELGRIDWKLFARSDRYFVREAERESEIEVWFLLDASASMQLKSENKKASQTDDNWDKFDYAKHLVASLAYIAQKQGDSIGFLGLSCDEISFLPAANGERHWRKLLQKLTCTKSGDQFPSFELLHRHLNQLRKPSLVFVLSDFHQRQSEITEFIGKLNTLNSEVVALQLMCDDELVFDFKGAVRFKDLETEEEVLVSAGSAKEAYLQTLENYQKSINESLLQRNVGCFQINIDEPLDAALYEYLKQRQRAGSGAGAGAG